MRSLNLKALLCALCVLCGYTVPAAQTVVPGDSQIAAPSVATNESWNVSEGQIIGKPLQTVSVSLAWTDEALTNADVAGYHVYYGVGEVALSNYFTVTNWLKTNGLAEITLSNVNPGMEYTVMLNAFDKLGNDSSNTTELSFIAPGYLLAALGTNGIELSFQTTSNRVYTLQSTTSMLKGANQWLTVATPQVNQGIVTVTNNTAGAARIFRLLIQ